MQLKLTQLARVAVKMESLLDEVAIKALVTKERYYRDSAQFDALRDCYHPDASHTFIDITW
jgi:hypothetical protein